MKILTLIRHAKSSWDDAILDDFERPLNKRGKRDAPFMGEKLKAMGMMPDQFLSSPAKRANATAEKIAKKIGYPQNAIILKPSLYLASTFNFFEVVRAIDNNFNKIFLVGHNPGITDFANMLTNSFIDNVPTTGIVAVKFDVKKWSEITTGKLLFFEYPKKNLV
jgi:phosphohistidine phosphatase